MRNGADVDAIERVITIAASPELVFGFLTDPEQYVLWKGRFADLQPRPHGRYRVDLGEGRIVRGEYIEVVPFRRVVFTWGWEGSGTLPPGSSTVEIELEPHAGGTRLRLVHRGLAESERSGQGDGWDRFLPRLTAVAEGRTPAD